ncbi:hypothetical protein LIER_30139 [Lithospermum erythrorhizon]|uniref:Uncharacterized protein n=1 Tax=Lithospermum erythrorhizon TaxID=34254 RepID=A0AAV3RQM2_LITER
MSPILQFSAQDTETIIDFTLIIEGIFHQHLCSGYPRNIGSNVYFHDFSELSEYHSVPQQTGILPATSVSYNQETPYRPPTLVSNNQETPCRLHLLLIRTPALKSFSIDGTSVGFQSLESLNLLCKAKITLESYDGDESSLYLHLIEAIHPVKLLHLDASAFRVVGHLPLYKRFLHN